MQQAVTRDDFQIIRFPFRHLLPDTCDELHYARFLS